MYYLRKLQVFFRPIYGLYSLPIRRLSDPIPALYGTLPIPYNPYVDLLLRPLAPYAVPIGSLPNPIRAVYGPLLALYRPYRDLYRAGMAPTPTLYRPHTDLTRSYGF